MRHFLNCVVLCIGATACAVDRTDPVGSAIELTAAAEPSVSAPTSPSTGIDPCIGYASGLFGAVATYSLHAGVVSFHGGTWTVPIPVRPGQALSEVDFTIEAPTGTLGDPTDVRVGLYSNGVALAFAHLAPAGLGARVSGSIRLNDRVVVSGEVLELEFAPLDAVGGTYAVSDTKIDTAQMYYAPRARPVWPVIRFGAASQSEAADPVTGSGGQPVRRFNVGASIYAEIPFTEGETITGFSMELAGDGFVDGSLEIGYGTRSGGQVQIGTLTSFSNVPLSWATYRTAMFSPTVLSSDGQLSLVLTASSPNLYWGYITPVFSGP